MGCCGEDAVKVSKMALELKSGQMLHYKHRIFGRNWREVYVVLYNDSTLAWYKDKGLTDQESGLIVKNAPELVAYGQFTNMIPNRPELPENYAANQLLAFGTRGKESVYWFLCPTEQEVESWMTAISNTLPPPPQPPQPPPPPPIPQTEASAPEADMQQQNSLMPQVLAVPSPQQAMPPPYQPHPAQVGIPGQYPTPTGFRAPPYTASPLHPAYPYSIQARGQPSANGGNTTVVVQDRRNDGGDFAMGMIMGGALGTTMGYSWGHGIGWGHGWGGHGYYSGGTNVNDTDVTINNYYDYDNTVVNNDIDIDASRDITVNDDVIASDFGGDFDGGDMGGDFDIGDIGGF